MKSLLITIILLLSFVEDSFSQATFGMRYGYNTTAFYVSSNKTISSRFGGLYVDFPMGNSNRFTIEVNRKRIGGELKNLQLPPNGYNDDSRVFDMDVDIRYLEIPLLWKFYRKIRNKYTFRPYIGVSLPMIFTMFHRDYSEQKNLRPFQEGESYIAVEGSDQYNDNGTVTSVVLGSSVEYKKIGFDFRIQSSITGFNTNNIVTDIDKRQFNLMFSFIFIFGTQQKQ